MIALKCALALIAMAATSSPFTAVVQEATKALSATDSPIALAARIPSAHHANATHYAL